MKTLSVRQPWASLIVHGRKPVENRSWSTKYRGHLAIHAGMTTAPKDQLLFLYRLIQADVAPLVPSMAEDLPKGAIIGTVDLVDVVEGYDSPWTMDTRYQWVFENPVVFDEPIPATGKLGLWNWADKSLVDTERG